MKYRTSYQFIVHTVVYNSYRSLYCSSYGSSKFIEIYSVKAHIRASLVQFG